MSDELLPSAERGSENEFQNTNPRSVSDIELQELLPGFVLGALSPDEMLAVEDYLQAHPEWQARLDALDEAAASLAHAAPRAPLPDRAREQLLQRARSDTPLIETRRAEMPVSRLRTPDLPPAAESTVRGMRRIPAAQPRPEPVRLGWFGIFWRTVSVASAVAAIALLAVISWRLQQNTTQLAVQVQALQTELAQMQQENTNLQQRSLALQTQLEQQTGRFGLIAAAEQVIPLAGQAGLSNAHGEFYRRGNEAVIIVSGLPPLAEGETYQLWLLPSLDHSIPSEVFQVANSEVETLNVPLDPAHGNLVGIGVSIEPAGGSQTPTTVIMLGTET